MILGGYARDLTERELRGAAARIALRPDIWSPLVHHDPDERTWQELYRDEYLGAWVICWMRGHDTGFHHHAGSAGAVIVASGTILEQRIGPLGSTVGNLYSRGAVFDFGPSVVHRVRHHGIAPATTIHVYSPPIADTDVSVAREIA
jgi:hypothetical protein